MKINNFIGKIGIFISLSSLYLVSIYFGKTDSYIGAVLFGVGFLIGWFLLEFDELFLYKYYDLENKNLATRSLLFIFSLLPLGIFLITSTGSSMGVGLFIGVVSVLSLEMFNLRKSLSLFKDRFLFQLKRDLSMDEQNVFISIFIGLSLLFGFLVIFAGR